MQHRDGTQIPEGGIVKPLPLVQSPQPTLREFAAERAPRQLPPVPDRQRRLSREIGHIAQQTQMPRLPSLRRRALHRLLSGRLQEPIVEKQVLPVHPQFLCHRAAVKRRERPREEVVLEPIRPPQGVDPIGDGHPQGMILPRVLLQGVRITSFHHAPFHAELRPDVVLREPQKHQSAERRSHRNTDAKLRLQKLHPQQQKRKNRPESEWFQ